MAKEYNLKEISDVIDHIRTALVQISLNANPRLVLEVIMLAIPGVKMSDTGSAVNTPR